MNWIKTSEKLPEADTRVIAYKKDSYLKIHFLWYNKYHNCWDDEDADDFYCDIDQVSHWMPLPEPPKD